jgi:Sulfotransferase family
VTDPFLFLVGYQRSGTTLLRAMFDSHPSMAVPDESHFIPSMALRRRRYEHRGMFRTEDFLRDLLERHRRRSWWVPQEDVRRDLAAAPPRDVAEAFRRVYRCYAASRGKRRYGDKTPSYVLNIGLLARLFPESRFVHIIRDGRDVALSILERPFGPDTIEEAAFRWRQAMHRGRAEGSRLGGRRYRELRYEDLVDDQESALRSLCAFADLPFDSAMTRYYENAALISERSWFRPISLPPTKGLRDWRRDMAPRDLAVFESLAGGTLEDLGYERSGYRSRPMTVTQAWAKWSAVQARRPLRRIRRLAAARSGSAVAPGNDAGRIQAP